MKRLVQILVFILFFLTSFYGNAQVTFISQFSGNQGGVTPLFNEVVPIGGNIFVNWEVFVDGTGCGGTGSAGAGKGSDCRVVVRGLADAADPQSVIASQIICTVSGTYSSENGNNDVYFANLNVCNLPTGRYSFEVQCDCLGGDYDNATGGPTAATTWDYALPESPTYYYGGTAGACGVEDGLDAFSVNGDGTGGWRESDDICGGCVNAQLEYFTVGDVDVYRTMVVLNGLFLDMGKFQPGNPTLPTNLNNLQNLYDPACVSINSFPTVGFCSDDVLTLDGAETNIFKWDCGDGFGTGNDADVTGNRLCYRVYLSGSPAPIFTCINVPFLDDCPNGGPGGNTFPVGGSCQNQNGILDQRWQTTSANIDLLASATVPGTYTLDLYTETDVVNCGGVASTVREPLTAPTALYSTTFERLDDAVAGCTVLPIELTGFTAKYLSDKDYVVLNWQTASEIESSHFEIERSVDAKNWSVIGKVASAGSTITRQNYSFDDKGFLPRNIYYRLKQVDLDGSFEYSNVEIVNVEKQQKDIRIFPNPVKESLYIETGGLQIGSIQIYDSRGSIIETSFFPSRSNLKTHHLSNGLYLLIIKDEKGAVIFIKQFLKQ